VEWAASHHHPAQLSCQGTVCFLSYLCPSLYFLVSLSPDLIVVVHIKRKLIPNLAV
jgi:hypothetical protein